MYAVIESGAKQYRVEKDDIINVEKLDAKVGDKLTLTEVLVIGNDNETFVGAPYIEGAKVEAEVLEQGKADKVVVLKYKAKKDYRKKQGHRQPYTQLKITSIAMSK